MKDGMYGYNQGDMKSHVEDMAKPEAAYSQKYDQSPLNYIERQDKRQMSECKKLKNEEFKNGKY